MIAGRGIYPTIPSMISPTNFENTRRKILAPFLFFEILQLDNKSDSPMCQQEIHAMEKPPKWFRESEEENVKTLLNKVKTSELHVKKLYIVVDNKHHFFLA